MTPCLRPLADWLELPIRRLAEESAGVVVKNFGCGSFVIAAAAKFEIGIGQLRWAGFAPVAGTVYADHLGAVDFQDINRALWRRFADGIDRQAGPETGVAGHSNCVFFAMVDQHALRGNSFVVF